MLRLMQMLTSQSRIRSSLLSFRRRFPPDGQHIIDLGCGPAGITIRLAGQYPQARVVGLDGADAMLEIARKTILRHTSLADRVDIRKWHIGREENPLGSESFHAVVSNSLLHHMRDPLDLWRAIRALAAPGAAVLVMDLIRPQSRIEAEQIVDKYAGKEPEVLRDDFLNPCGQLTFRSDLAICDVHIPLLIVHGDDDRVIPITLARRLFERANEPKEFITVVGGGHLVLGSTEVFVRVREWIDRKTVMKRHSGTARK
jgi:SAM-dependent methyltransferase